MQQKKIIIFISILFLISSVYLFTRNSQYKNTDNWWALSFTDPKSDNLSFVIENFSTSPNFHWELFADKDKLSEGDAQINAEEKEVVIDNKVLDKKMTIRVSSGQETKEIYKNPTQ